MLNSNTRLLVVAIAVVIILFPFGYSVVHAVFSQGASLPESPAGEGYCLDDVPREYMRFHHMDLLKDLRDEIVRYGHGEVEFHGKRRERGVSKYFTVCKVAASIEGPRSASK